MKRELQNLPEKNQRELQYIAGEIRAHLPSVEMIILYGSYAYGNFVAYDERIEFEVQTSYMSDYDILVLVAEAPTDRMEEQLDKIDLDFFTLHHPPIHFLLLSVKEMNEYLSKNAPFHSVIKRKGIVLYDSGNARLASPHPLNLDEKYVQANEYFTERFTKGKSFLRSAGHDFDDGDYSILAFHAHQACEAFFHTILLTFTFDNRKLHDLNKLLKAVLKYAPELRTLFPRNTKKEKLIFKLLKNAYTEGRYNKRFSPTREEVLLLLEKVRSFEELTSEICRKQIDIYRSASEQDEPEKIRPCYPEKRCNSNVAAPPPVVTDDAGKDSE